MSEFDIKDYWENRYQSGGNSGAGSYDMEAKAKAEFINNFIKNSNIETITEIGCGDGNNLAMYEGFKSYSGYDISPKAIQMCNDMDLHSKTGSNYYFTSDLNKIDYQPDLCLCLDVIFHQVNDDDYYSLLELLFQIMKSKYIIIYGYSSADNQGMSAHMKMRDFLSDIKSYENLNIMEVTTGFDKKKIFAVLKNS